MTCSALPWGIGVIGLGYVGLPLAASFGRRFATVGFDIQPARIAELEAGTDSTLEVDPGAEGSPYALFAGVRYRALVRSRRRAR